MENITEEWRPVKRCNNELEISNLGNLRRCVDHIVRSNGRVMKVTPRSLPWSEAGGSPSDRYLGRQTRFGWIYAHIAVAEAFIGDVPAGMQVCHQDGTRKNNVWTNLRIDTRSGNFADKKLHGTSNVGKCINQKLDVDKVREIKQHLADGELTGEKIAAMMNLTPSMISQIKTGKCWSYVTI